MYSGLFLLSLNCQHTGNINGMGGVITTEIEANTTECFSAFGPFRILLGNYSGVDFNVYDENSDVPLEKPNDAIGFYSQSRRIYAFYSPEKRNVTFSFSTYMSTSLLKVLCLTNRNIDNFQYVDKVIKKNKQLDVIGVPTKENISFSLVQNLLRDNSMSAINNDGEIISTIAEMKGSLKAPVYLSFYEDIAGLLFVINVKGLEPLENQFFGCFDPTKDGFITKDEEMKNSAQDDASWIIWTCVVAFLVVVAIIGILVWFFFFKNKNERNEQDIIIEQILSN